MTEAELELKKRKLVESLGVQLEKDNLAPVAARIFATLILAGQKGVTFDELVSDLNASKSTVSTHLDQLQSNNKIQYFTKPGDRKRYFIINPNLMLNVIDEMIAKWDAQKVIHEQVLEYKEKRNEFNKEIDKYQLDLDFQKDFLTFLDEATTAIRKLKTNISNRKDNSTTTAKK
ncbi:MAG TPA: transcriptional regulator [Salinimicrobium sp.]|nr:transcriptional regulator [Salinimicrobium sp.]